MNNLKPEAILYAVPASLLNHMAIGTAVQQLIVAITL